MITELTKITEQAPPYSVVSGFGQETHLPDVSRGIEHFPEGGSSDTKPLTLTGAGNGNILVVPGYVNSIMPTLGGTALDDVNGPPLIALPSGTTYVWIKMVSVFSGSSTVTIVTNSSSSPPAGTAISATGYTSYKVIGYAVNTAGVVVITNLHSGGHLGVDSFGAVNLWWRT